MAILWVKDRINTKWMNETKIVRCNIIYIEQSIWSDEFDVTLGWENDDDNNCKHNTKASAEK